MQATYNNYVIRLFRHSDFSERTLKYRQHKIKANTIHQVIVYRPAGEDIAPMVYNFSSVKEAREQWDFIQKRWIESGNTVISTTTKEGN